VSISVKCKEIWLAFLRVLSFCSFVPFVVNLYPWSWEPFCVADQRGSARIWVWMIAECLPSFVSFLCIPLCPLWLNPFRLLNEEKVLRNQLPGYAEYCQQTRYRLLPGIW